MAQWVKNLHAMQEHARDMGSIPGLGGSPGGGHGNLLQYSCLENAMDRGAWWATYSPLGRKVLDTQLSIGFSRQECWSGLLFPPPGDPPNPGVEP